MLSSDNLGEIVNTVRSELGYGVYQDSGFWSEVRGQAYWLFRNIMKMPIVPIKDEELLIVLSAVSTRTADNMSIQFLMEDYNLIQILPHAVESFPKVFKAGMQAYLEQRHYVTEPRQVLDYIEEVMLKQLTPSQSPH